MLPVLNLSKRVEFISPRDPNKDNKGEAFIFKISAIPSRVYTVLKDRATSYGADEKNPDGLRADFSPNKIATDIVRFGLKDIENFRDENGPIKFKTQKERVGNSLFDVVHDDVIDILGIDTIREVSDAIRDLCEFKEEDEKNLEG